MPITESIPPTHRRADTNGAAASASSPAGDRSVRGGSVSGPRGSRNGHRDSADSLGWIDPQAAMAHRDESAESDDGDEVEYANAVLQVEDLAAPGEGSAVAQAVRTRRSSRLLPVADRTSVRRSRPVVAPRVDPALKTRLLGLATDVPAHSARQDEVLGFMTRVLEETVKPDRQRAALRLLDVAMNGSGVERRHSVIPDFTFDDPEQFTFYPPNWALAPSPSTAERMARYEAEVTPLAEGVARKALERSGVAPSQVTHLVLSTCTGLVAPGPDILLLERLGLPSTTHRLQLAFMGCQGSFNALRAADHIVRANPDAVVLHVAIELCSLHYQMTPSVDALAGSSLFADGASAFVLGSTTNESLGGADGSGRGLATIRSAHAAVQSDSRQQMAWAIGTTGFEMVLSSAVPRSIQAGANDFVTELLARADVARDEVVGYAAHPGGRRVLEAVERGLNLDSAALETSREVLRNYGNMSSATIGFVLEQELPRHTEGPLVALGFGPGLSMEGLVFDCE